MVKREYTILSDNFIVSGDFNSLIPDSFLDLGDTPVTYSGQTGKVVAVNATEDGLEFINVVTDVSWGDITGTLSNQTDLQAALDLKADASTLSTHISDATIHFTEASISHLNIQNIGTNTHEQIDLHIANTSNPHSVSIAQVGNFNADDTNGVLYWNGTSVETDSGFSFDGNILNTYGLAVSDFNTAGFVKNDANGLLSGGNIVLASEVLLDSISGATYTTVQQMQDIFHSTGSIDGVNSISDNGDGTYAVAAGQGYIRATNDQTDTLLPFDWEANASLTPSEGRNYVGVEYNAGSPQVVQRSSYNWNFQTDFPLGEVVKEGAVLHIFNAPHKVGDHAGKMIEAMEEVMPFARDERSGGLIIGETGTRNMTLSAGSVWYGLTEYPISALDTSVSGDFDAYYRDGVGGWTLATGNTQWDNNQYDDNSGTLATMTPAKYAVHWFYIDVEDGGKLVVIYSQNQYNTIAEANDATTPATLPARLLSHGRILGRIIFQASASSATAIESVFETTFGATGVQNHNDLAGLQGGTSGEYNHLTNTEYALLQSFNLNDTNGVAFWDGDSLETDANFTWDGSELAVTGNVDLDGNVSIGSTPSSTFQLLVQPNGGATQSTTPITLGVDIDYNGSSTTGAALYSVVSFSNSAITSAFAWRAFLQQTVATLGNTYGMNLLVDGKASNNYIYYGASQGTHTGDMHGLRLDMAGSYGTLYGLNITGADANIISGTLQLSDYTSAGFLKNDASGNVTGGNSIDISSDTNLVAGNALTLTGDTIDFDFLIDQNVRTSDDVQFSTLVLETTGQASLILNDTSTTGSPFIAFNQDGARRGFLQFLDSDDVMRLASEYGGIAFYTGTGGTETEKMRIEADGDVAIGTTTGAYRLTVYDDTTTSADTLYVYNGATDVGEYAGINIGGSTNIRNISLTSTYSTDALTFWTRADSPTASIERMRIDDEGFVGIATTVPDSELHVDGDIQAGNYNSAGEGILIGYDSGSDGCFVYGGGNDLMTIKSGVGYIGYGNSSTVTYNHEFFGTVYANSSLSVSGQLNALSTSNFTGAATFNDDVTLDFNDYTDQFTIDADVSATASQTVVNWDFDNTYASFGFGYVGHNFDINIAANAGSIYGVDMDITTTGTTSPPTVYGYTIDISTVGTSTARGFAASISDVNINTGAAIYGSTNTSSTGSVSGKWAAYFDGHTHVTDSLRVGGTTGRTELTVYDSGQGASYLQASIGTTSTIAGLELFNSTDSFELQCNADNWFWYHRTDNVYFQYYDGTNDYMAIGSNLTTPLATLHVMASNAAMNSVPAGTTLAIESNSTNYITFMADTGESGNHGLTWGDSADNLIAGLWYQHSADHFYLYHNNEYRMVIDGDGKMKYTDGSQTSATGVGLVEIETTSTFGDACLLLDQNDIDQPFIHFEGTSGTGTANSISTQDVGSASTTGPSSSTYQNDGMIRVEISGEVRWIPYYREV